MSLLEGSLSGVEALRHIRLDLQSRKKVGCTIGVITPCCYDDDDDDDDDDMYENSVTFT